MTGFSEKSRLRSIHACRLRAVRLCRLRAARTGLWLATSVAAIALSVGYLLVGEVSARSLALTPTTVPSVDNPLGLPVAPSDGNPLASARFFVDHESEVSLEARDYPELRVIADQPGTARFGPLSGPDVGSGVHSYLVRASRQEPGTVPLLATYWVVDGHCGSWTPTSADEASYRDFISRFAQGVGNHRAVLFLEMDALITTPCLTPQGVAIRMAELHDAITELTATCRHLVIYLDAGAADALPPARTASLLLSAGVAQIQGFFLNSTHFDWTMKEIGYGETISRLTGGKHFVINTGEDGRGPLIPPDRVHQGNEVLCNPPGRGLGPKPTTDTGIANVDAFAWTSNPGESGGACVPGAPPTGDYWPAYGMMLVQNADFSVTGPRFGASARRAKPSRHAGRSHRRGSRGARRH